MNKKKSYTFCKLLRELDVFGEKIVINYKGSETFKTKYGAVLTIFTFLLMMTFSILKINKLIMRTNPLQTQNTVITSGVLSDHT